AADEFALYVQLRHGRPIGEGLDALADFHVLQDVNAFISDAAAIEDRYRAAREAALREQRRAVHEQDDVVFADDLGDADIGIGHGLNGLTIDLEWLGSVGN